VARVEEHGSSILLDIKTIYDDIVAGQPVINKAPLTPLQEIEEREKKRAIDVDTPNGKYAGDVLAPSPALIQSIAPEKIKASTAYNATSGQGFEAGYSVDYPMLRVEYDIAFDNSLYEQVRLIHNNTLVHVGGDILKFSYERFECKTIHGNPWHSYVFRIALKLTSISLLKKQPTAAEIGVSAPRNSQCFIATAAFGHRDQTEVITLRKYRDEVLVASGVGRVIVGAYETLSPPVAATIRCSSVLRRITRTVLRRVVLPFVRRMG